MLAQRSPKVPVAKDYLDLLNADSAALFESGNVRVQAEPALFKRWSELNAKIQDRVKASLDVPLVCVFELEDLQIRLLPDHRVLSKAWSVRQSYLSIVSKELAQKYAEMGPPDLKKPNAGDIPLIRSDMEDLVSGLHWWYVSAFRKERSLRRLKCVLLGATLAGLLMCIGATAILAYDSAPGDFLFVMSPVEMIFYVLYAGFLGAVTSTIRRIQPVAEEPIATSDPLIKTTVIEQGHVGVYLSIALGAVFALVMYLVLATGINLSIGPSAPQFRASASADPCADCTIYRFFFDLFPASPADFAKLLVWAFVAGFSERLVPDMLDRFGKKK